MNDGLAFFAFLQTLTKLGREYVNLKIVSLLAAQTGRLLSWKSKVVGVIEVEEQLLEDLNYHTWVSPYLFFLVVQAEQTLLLYNPQFFVIFYPLVKCTIDPHYRSTPFQHQKGLYLHQIVLPVSSVPVVLVLLGNLQHYWLPLLLLCPY